MTIIIDYWKVAAPKMGIEIKSIDLYPAGTSDYSNYIAKAKAQNADAWVSVAYPNESVEMVKQFKAAGYAPKMFVSQLLKFQRQPAQEAPFPKG